MPAQKAALILAAGQGKRMHSSLPKVLHRCAGLPLVCHVIRLAQSTGCSPIVVVVSPYNSAPIEKSVRTFFPNATLHFAIQQIPQGTGDAARAGMDSIADFAGKVLILYGDVPMLSPHTITRLETAAQTAPLAFLSAQLPDPTGYGRIRRDAAGQPSAVVEQRDATEAERAITEVNAGVYLADAALVRQATQALQRHNAQNEYYLTDIVATAAAQGGAAAVTVADLDEVRGVNSRADLLSVEQCMRRQLLRTHQDRGVTFTDPANTFLEVDVSFGSDVTVGVGVQLSGHTHLGDEAQVDGPSVIINSRIGARARIHAFSHLEGAVVGADAIVGPYARLRPEAILEDNSHVGNFVELKKTRLGRGSKANHLAYLGDADIGPGSNIGAGTITCNYDGINKYRTDIGPESFVGSNSTLVAPVTLGARAYVAAGSTVTQDVPADALAFGRARQSNREGYAKDLRARLRAKKKKET